MPGLSFVHDEPERRRMFPVAAHHVFFAHAGVAPLPRVAEEALQDFARRGAEDGQESAWAWAKVREARQAAAALLGASEDEISLLGPTSLGLNLVALGLDWRPGDEVVYCREDYPANVYPWAALENLGVAPVPLHSPVLGAIAWEDVEAALTPRTRLVALASCHFLSGYRIDVDGIGRRLHDRGILFCLDAIQTLGAFPLSVEHVDFLSADSHKWLLGPCGAGIFYVKTACRERLRPALVGSWNVVSPQFVAQDAIQFETGGRRYEPGILNIPGIAGMLASMRLLLDIGIDAIGQRLLELRGALVDRLRPLGYQPLLDADTPDADRHLSGIVSVSHPTRDLAAIVRELDAGGVSVSLRHNRLGQAFIRFSPHFYNTDEEIDRAIALMQS